MYIYWLIGNTQKLSFMVVYMNMKVYFKADYVGIMEQRTPPSTSHQFGKQFNMNLLSN